MSPEWSSEPSSKRLVQPLLPDLPTDQPTEPTSRQLACHSGLVTGKSGIRSRPAPLERLSLARIPLCMRDPHLGPPGSFIGAWQAHFASSPDLSLSPGLAALVAGVLHDWGTQ